MEKTVEAMIIRKKASASDSMRSQKSIGAHSVGALSIFDPESADTLVRDEFITFDIYDDRSKVSDSDHDSRPVSGVIESWQDLGDLTESFTVQKSATKDSLVNGEVIDITPMKNGWHTTTSSTSEVITGQTSGGQTTPGSQTKTMLTQDNSTAAKQDVSRVETVTTVTKRMSTSSNQSMQNGGESASSTLESQKKSGTGVRKKGSFTLKSSYNSQNIKHEQPSGIAVHNGDIGGNFDSSLNRKLVNARSNVVNRTSVSTAATDTAYQKEKADHIRRNASESYTVASEVKRPIQTDTNKEAVIRTSLLETKIRDTSETGIPDRGANKNIVQTQITSSTTISGGVGLSNGTSKAAPKKGLYSKKSYSLVQDSDGDVKKSSSQTSSSVSSSAAPSRTSSNASSASKKKKVPTATLR